MLGLGESKESGGWGVYSYTTKGYYPFTKSGAMRQYLFQGEPGHWSSCYGYTLFAPSILARWVE